jgi:hypothetical protein
VHRHPHAHGPGPEGLGAGRRRPGLRLGARGRVPGDGEQGPRRLPAVAQAESGSLDAVPAPPATRRKRGRS